MRHDITIIGLTSASLSKNKSVMEVLGAAVAFMPCTLVGQAAAAGCQGLGWTQEGRRCKGCGTPDAEEGSDGLLRWEDLVQKIFILVPANLLPVAALADLVLVKFDICSFSKSVDCQWQ